MDKEKMARYLRRAWVSFNDFTDTNPTVAQSIQACLIMSCGDLLAQKYIERKTRLDKRRLLTFAGVGLLFVGPIVSNWVRILDRKVPSHWPQLQRGLTKMVVDQAFMAPLMLACVLSILEMSLVEASTEAVKKRLKSSYWTILKTNYMVWPLVQLLNFTLIPVKLQLMFTQMIGLAWNSFLSMKATARA